MYYNEELPQRFGQPDCEVQFLDISNHLESD